MSNLSISLYEIDIVSTVTNGDLRIGLLHFLKSTAAHSWLKENDIKIGGHRSKVEKTEVDECWK